MSPSLLFFVRTITLVCNSWLEKNRRKEMNKNKTIYHNYRNTIYKWVKKVMIFQGGNPSQLFFRSPHLPKINPVYAPVSCESLLLYHWCCLLQAPDVLTSSSLFYLYYSCCLSFLAFSFRSNCILSTFFPNVHISTPAFENSVVRAPATTKKVAGQPKILMWLSDGRNHFSCPSFETRPH